MKTFLAAFVLAMLVPSAARACASCGCGDPTLTVMGAETPFAGRLRVSLEARTADVAQGAPGLDQQVTRENRLDLGVSWAPLDRLVLAARFPFVVRNTEAANLAGATAFGPGDLEVSARFVLLRDRPLAPRHVLSVIGGSVLPTGVQEGGVDVTPGAGAFTPMAGLAYTFMAGSFSLHASAIGYLPASGWYELRTGRSIRAGTTVQWQATPWLAARVGADLRSDRPSMLGGSVEPDTGGTVAWASPGVAVSPATDWLLVGTARLPFAADLVGNQRVGPVFSLGVVRDF